MNDLRDSDGVSASSTTSAGDKLNVFNNLAKSASEGISDCTGFCTDFLHSTRPSGRSRFPEPHKQFLNRFFAWVHVAHRGLNVIVSRYVLQRERIGVLPGLGQKRVTQRMQARIRVRLDLFAQLRHLLFKHPGPERLPRILRAREHVLAVGLFEEPLEFGHRPYQRQETWYEFI